MPYLKFRFDNREYQICQNCGETNLPSSQEIFFNIDDIDMTITPEYKNYLKSKKWKVRRKQVLERDNYTCQECGNKAWQVHHLTYKRIFNERLNDLISLCEDCHKEIHNKPKQISIFGRILAKVIG